MTSIELLYVIVGAVGLLILAAVIYRSYLDIGQSTKSLLTKNYFVDLEDLGDGDGQADEDELAVRLDTVMVSFESNVASRIHDLLSEKITKTEFLHVLLKQAQKSILAIEYWRGRLGYSIDDKKTLCLHQVCLVRMVLCAVSHVLANNSNAGTLTIGMNLMGRPGKIGNDLNEIALPASDTLRLVIGYLGTDSIARAWYRRFRGSREYVRTRILLCETVNYFCKTSKVLKDILDVGDSIIKPTNLDKNAFCEDLRYYAIVRGFDSRMSSLDDNGRTPENKVKKKTRRGGKKRRKNNPQ